MNDLPSRWTKAETVGRFFLQQIVAYALIMPRHETVVTDECNFAPLTPEEVNFLLPRGLRATLDVANHEWRISHAK